MRSILILILCCLLGEYTMAIKKVLVSPEPAWLYKTNADLAKKPVNQNISDGYYIELADQQVNLVNVTKYTHFIRHIINESGVQNASEISVTFAPEFQQVIYHKVLLIRDGRAINQLREDQIKVVQEETDASDFQYNGLKRAFVTLKDVRKGDRIEVSYSVTGFNPVFANKYDDKFYFYSHTSICNYFLTIFSAQGRKLFIKEFNNASKPQEQVQGQLRVYQWTNPELKAWEYQAGVPSWYDNYPYISITEYPSWENVINWGLDIFKNYQYPLPASLQDKIAYWHKMANGDKDSFADLAIRFVQDQVRYLGLEIGNYTHKPHSPEDVYRQKFGDCKDKALLLTMLLQKEGINAFVALVNTSVRGKLSEAAPSPGEFDHAIVAIERSANVYIYIDATSSSQRGGLINLYIPDYGYALILRKGETRLQHMEPGSLYSTTIEETLFAPFKDTASFTVTTTYVGGAADNIRGSLADMSSDELEKNYRTYYAKLYDGIQSSAGIIKTDDSIKNEFTVKEAYSIPRLWHTAEDGRETFEVFAKPVFEQVPNPSGALKDAPLAIEFPTNLHYTLVLNMPEDWGFSFTEIHIKNDSYQFDFVPSMLANQITLRYTYKTFKDHIPAEKLSEYKMNYKQMEEKLDFQMYYGSKQSAGKSSESNGSSSSSKTVNWNAVWLAFFFAVSFTALIKRLDKRSEEVIYTPESGWPLGGWTTVLGITIGLGIVARLWMIVKYNYFSYASWEVLGNAGGGNLQLLLLVELGFALLWTGSAVALLYWFLGRRDIFPRMFVWYLGSLLVGQLLLIILYKLVPYPSVYGDLSSDTGVTFLRSCIYAGIWYAYLQRSERVKSTFLQPYSRR